MLEESGEWWLPDHPEDRVPGVLRFDYKDAGTLSLHGRLTDPFADGKGKPRLVSYPRLHGLAGNTRYTLDEGFVSEFDFIENLETVVVNRVLRGRWFPANERLAATTVSFGVTGLADWIRESGLDEDSNFEAAPGEPVYRLSAHRKPDRTAVTEDGRTVRLWHDVQLDLKRWRSSMLRENFRWDVKAPRGATMPLDELLASASDLQDLVSVATGQTAVLEELRFAHPEWREQFGAHEFNQPVELYAARLAEPTETSVHEMFTFAQFGGIEGVARWLDAAARHRGPLGSVMETRYAPGKFPADRLLSCTAALEAFDRTENGNGNASLVTRLHRCANLAGAPFAALVGDIGVWAAAVRDERNDVAHHLGRPVLDSGARTGWLWQSLYHLFVLCMFRASAATAETFTAVQRSPEYEWLAERRGFWQ